MYFSRANRKLLNMLEKHLKMCRSSVGNFCEKHFKRYGNRRLDICDYCQTFMGRIVNRICSEFSLSKIFYMFNLFLNVDDLCWYKFTHG